MTHETLNYHVHGVERSKITTLLAGESSALPVRHDDFGVLRVSRLFEAPSSKESVAVFKMSKGAKSGSMPEVEEHISTKYEIRKRLGKGVSRFLLFVHGASERRTHLEVVQCLPLDGVFKKKKILPYLLGDTVHSNNGSFVIMNYNVITTRHVEKVYVLYYDFKQNKTLGR